MVKSFLIMTEEYEFSAVSEERLFSSLSVEIIMKV